MTRWAIDYPDFEDRPLLLYAHPPANFPLSSFNPGVVVVLDDYLAGLISRSIRLHPGECLDDFYRQEHKLNFLGAQSDYIVDPYGRRQITRWAEAFELA